MRTTRASWQNVEPVRSHGSLGLRLKFQVPGWGDHRSGVSVSPLSLARGRIHRHTHPLGSEELRSVRLEKPSCAFTGIWRQTLPTTGLLGEDGMLRDVGIILGSILSISMKRVNVHALYKKSVCPNVRLHRRTCNTRSAHTSTAGFLIN